MNKKETETEHLQAAEKSWRGRWLRDGFENRLGIVLEVHQEDTLVLHAKFQGEKKPRVISLEPRPDGEFVHPDEVRARYRLLSDEEARSMLA